MKVPCLTCEHLEISKEKDGLWFRCGCGLYDTPEGITRYHAISGMVAGNVNIWRATGYPNTTCDYKQIES